MKRAEFKAILKSYISTEKEYLAEHEEIKAILKPLILKPINGKTLNQKVLGKFKFSERSSLFYISGKFDHLIGYPNSENVIAIEKIEGISRGFEELDACHGYAAKNRIKQVESIDFEKAFKIFNGIDKAFNTLRELFGELEREKLGSFNFPAYYDTLRAISPDEQYIKLHQFYYIRK